MFDRLFIVRVFDGSGEYQYEYGNFEHVKTHVNGEKLPGLVSMYDFGTQTEIALYHF